MKIKQKNGEYLEIRSIDYEEETKIEYEDLIKEETRILYVALTRAKERVTWFEKEGQKTRNVSWSDLLNVGDRINYEK